MEDGRHASAHLAARLQRIPTTPYTWMIVIVAAGAMIVEALDIGSLAIILPPVKQLMHLSPGRVGILAASSALGIAIGMVPTGFLADRLGRKRLLMGGLLWFTVATMLAALSPNYLVLVLLRGLAGLGMAPVFIMPYAIVSEFVSSTTRAAFAGLLETALGIGYLLPPVLGLLVVPHFSADVSWRIFLFIAGTPMLYVLVIWRYLPESPRWLSRVGRQGEADEIVTALERRIEAWLGRKLPPIEIGPEIAAAISAPRPRVSFAALKAVWQPPYLQRTIAMILGAFGTFSMFYVGVNYIPSLFLERHIGMTNAFLFTLVVSAVQIPGKILNGILSEVFGRKRIYVAYTIPAVIGAYEFGQTSEPVVMLAWACLFLFAASGSAPSYKMWYAEQYPTPIRATGQSTVESIGGRLIGGVIWTMIFPILIASAGMALTMTSLAVTALITCAIATLLAPETMGRSVEELEVAAIASPVSSAAPNVVRRA
jgi:MFS transporter, putative metabolite:H+ symporter